MLNFNLLVTIKPLLWGVNVFQCSMGSVVSFEYNHSQYLRLIDELKGQYRHDQ